LNPGGRSLDRVDTDEGRCYDLADLLVVSGIVGLIFRFNCPPALTAVSNQSSALCATEQNNSQTVRHPAVD
jgi:hypothetical protein